MAGSFLEKIIEAKTKQVHSAKAQLPQDKIIKILKSLSEVSGSGDYLPLKRDFKQAISSPGEINLIAEIKASSPSAGPLRRDFKLLDIARAYQSAGAAALSVLTDKDFFSGDSSYVGRVKQVTDIPVLRKDFIIDKYQIYESALIESDCILLIADILQPKVLAGFLRTAALLNLDALVEANTQEALDKAVSSGAGIIGINNRNLDTFAVDIKTTQRLIKRIPKGRIIVSESGIKTKDDIEFLASLGVNAVLIGEVFMRAADIPRKVKEIMG